MANCFFCYKDSFGSHYHTKCCKRFFGTEIMPDLELDNKLLKELAEKTVNERISLTGVQPKISVALEKTRQNNRLTIIGLWGEYFLKPQHGRFASMPQTEDLTMHLAELFEMPVCRHTLLKATDGSLVYLAKRLDRVNGKKIHMEDFCQLSKFLTENKYKGSYEKTGKLVLKYCTNTGLDALNYFELVLFSYLTGNNDMHLKNFSVLHQDGQINLSPAYDLLNVSLINPSDNEELALTLNGKKRKFKLSDFEEFGNALQIPSKALKNTFLKFSSSNRQALEMIEDSFLVQEEKECYQEIWNKKQLLFGQ